MLFNLYVCHLPSQPSSCLLVSYADDSTLLKVIPTKDLRLSAAVEINADLCSITNWELIGRDDGTLNLNP